MVGVSCATTCSTAHTHTHTVVLAPLVMLALTSLGIAVYLSPSLPSLPSPALPSLPSLPFLPSPPLPSLPLQPSPFNEQVARDQMARDLERSGVLKVWVVRNNLETRPPDQHLMWLLEAKDVYSIQLPKMPKEYITRLVFCP